MRKLILFSTLGLTIVLACGAFAYYWNSPERHTTAAVFTGLAREVSDNVLLSPFSPAARIVVDPSLEYVGGQKFTLYGTAAVEQHVFGRRWPDGSPRSTLLFQFESVLPGVDWQYDYSSAEHRTTIGGFDFFTDVEPGRVWWLFPNGKPGTDGYRAKTLADQAGFPVPQDYVWHRSVHIPDGDARSELLIIWLEDLAPTGKSRDDFQQGGKGSAEWDMIARQSIESLNELITIEAEEP
ncbi:hypothetical protein [Erythrobacter ani]|uniref:Uncharacterized protein n=1 Tax=Erythrobacter ani TaxID=2827235 RepID=A0ABS6SNW5_9SPHN|nr:hypothetical protein [Erythrobacter ani]MBV7266197.1 hypothetical protein [Erythrobacter ani]